jgi:hypothetical protein
LPSNWANELKKNSVQKKSNTSSTTNNTVSQKPASNTVNISDFPKRLSELLQKNPQTLQNAAQIAKKNYK